MRFFRPSLITIAVVVALTTLVGACSPAAPTPTPTSVPSTATPTAFAEATRTAKLTAAAVKTSTPTRAVPTLSPTPKATNTPAQNRRLANGQFLKDSLGSGYGELTIENGRDIDAVAVLATLKDVTVVSVYVRAGNSFTIDGIEDGTYSLYFTLGEDWDSEAGKFTRKRSLSRFEDTLDFETTRTQYSIFEVTLQPVTGGNADTESVNAADFPSVK